jgi:hypothetical protein
LDWYGEKAKRSPQAKQKYNRSARPQTLLLAVVVTGLVLAFSAGIGTTILVSRLTSEARQQPTFPFPIEVGPIPSPTAGFGREIGMSGYREVTTERVGAIPAHTRVRISEAWLSPTGWVYTIVTSDEKTAAQASDSQLTYAPDVTPGVTPSN